LGQAAGRISRLTGLGCQTRGVNQAGGNRPRDTTLRRFREVVCFGCALVLWLLAWRVESSGFAGHRGRGALVALGALETLWLMLIFWREQSAAKADQVPWITLAWASLPAWCALQLLVGSLLGSR